LEISKRALASLLIELKFIYLPDIQASIFLRKNHAKKTSIIKTIQKHQKM